MVILKIPIVYLCLVVYWAVKAEVIRQLDWPDSRLVHFEDDYLLGEALHQNGYEIGRCESGVVIDCGARR